jgi:hypothetical protein
MNPKQISHDELVLFALQDLTPAEAAKVLVLLEHSEAARTELAQIQGDLAMFALTSDPHSPPAHARERLLARVAKEKRVVPLERSATARPATERPATDNSALEHPDLDENPIFVPRGGRVLKMEEEKQEVPVRRFGMGFPGWAGWAIAACLAVAVGLEYHQGRLLKSDLYAQDVKLAQITSQAARAEAVMQVLNDHGAMQVALRQPASGPPVPPVPQGHAVYTAGTGSLVFVAMHMAPLEVYKTYELWVIPADGQNPIPAGLFKPDQQGFASVILPELPKGVAAKTFGVTIEDDGGVSQPTMKNLVLLGM